MCLWVQYTEIELFTTGHITNTCIAAKLCIVGACRLTYEKTFVFSGYKNFGALQCKSNSASAPVFLAIYSPMFYTAPCVMLLMRADPLRGQVGGVGPWKLSVIWAL